MRNEGSAAERAKCRKSPVSVRDSSCAFTTQMRQAKGTLRPGMVLNDVVLHNSCAAFEETFLSAVAAVGRLWAPEEMCSVADPGRRSQEDIVASYISFVLHTGNPHLPPTENREE
jgi:hypothetical protein